MKRNFFSAYLKYGNIEVNKYLLNDYISDCQFMIALLIFSTVDFQVTLAGWGSFYNLKNEIQIGTLLKLINLRVSF